MNLFELFVKVGVKDEASKNLTKIRDGLGKGLKTAAKIGLAAVGAAAKGIARLTAAAVNNYAEYEQLVGGVETLFGAGGKTLEEYADSVGKSVDKASKKYDNLMRSQEMVLENSRNAFKTAGMSQNEYMSTVTSFSAALLASLKGDTVKAASYADKAIIDMADNANKMGTSMELIQNAYQGFAKQNYTMLDNLKLGYGGTQKEMKRLIKDAEKISGKDLSIKKYSDIIEAIHIIQDNMGITGTTAEEAGRTISGSVGAMKSAWANLVTGLADNNADLSELINNFVITLVGDGTEENLGVLGNILPAVETALAGAGTLVTGAIPKLIEILPGLLETIIPVLLESADSLVNAVIEVLPQLVDSVVNNLIEHAPDMIVAAVELILALAGGLIGAIPDLLAAIPKILQETIDGFKNSEKIKKFLEIGKNIIEGIKDGIKNAWNNLKEWFKGLFDDIIGIAKKILGIASPSKVFKKIGGFTAEGFGLGFEDEFANVRDDIEKAMTFDDMAVDIGSSIRHVGSSSGGANAAVYGGSQDVNVTVTIDENVNAMGLARELLPYLKIAAQEAYA